MNKKIVLSLLLIVLPFCVKAQTYNYVGAPYEYLIYKVEDGHAVVAYNSNYDGSRGWNFTIPETVSDGYYYYDVYEIAANGFYGKTYIRSVTFPENMATIGANAFAYCTGLQSLSFPRGKYMLEIQNQAFFGCTGLKGDLVFPFNLKSIGDGAFSECTGLDGELKITLEGGTNNLTSIGAKAFSKAGKLKGGLFLPKIESIGDEAFFECSSLNGKLVLGNKLTSLGKSAFYNCSGLTGGINLPKLTTIPDFVFNGCSNLDGELVLGQSLTSIGKQAFFNCEKLTGGINLPTSLESIGKNAFYQCKSFTGDLVIPDNVSVIGGNAFRECTGLTGSLTLGKSLKRLEKGTFYSTNLTGMITLPETLEYIGESAFSNTNLGGGDLIVPKSVKTIMPKAFFNPQTEWHSITFADGSQLVDIGAEVENDEGGMYSGVVFGAVASYIDMTACTNMQNRASNTNTFDRKGNNALFANSHPWVIIYLPPNRNFAGDESNGENFVHDSKCVNFNVYDTHDYPIRHAFKADKAEYRTINDDETDPKKRVFEAGTCYTLCLPYPSGQAGGMLSYQLTKQNRVENNEITNYFVFTSIAVNDSTKANKPYVLYNKTGEGLELPTMLNVDVPVSPADIRTEGQESDEDNMVFYGTTVRIPNKTLTDPTMYTRPYNLGKNKLWRPILKANEKGHVAPFRCFVDVKNGLLESKFVMILEEDESTTGIAEQTIREAIEGGNQTFYTTDGSIAGTDFDSLQSGKVYIVNGKKFYKP
ncbi:MAG: leucine-rich repeat domain-containing protein [Prevotella sp.]|uniref:leucine-rich repeat domain-containing protein n=1 Tax=Prevotella sp. TaxID=59823 RepID=UPI002A2CFF4F|nr:leucine-rich repeat domain-containing protein [Prevotella sp.]MDD7317154.1 leucine-rich repeat domain-containing protein [Prevotellaceae bacterium]MDY4019758.1 leucine-rich repeat domain-containing protein [Prevotella sp.]